MIKWFMSVVLVAALVAGAMILYLSPELRSQALKWAKSKNSVVMKRLKSVESGLPKVPSKDQFVKAKDLLLDQNANPKAPPSSAPKPSANKTPAGKAPSADKITDRDRAQLEQVLEKANK